MTGKITIKNKEEIEIMTLGGEKLGLIRDSLAKAVAAGVNAEEIDNLAFATKEDIAKLALATKQDFNDLAAETKQDMANLAAETKRDINRLEHKIDEIHFDTALKIADLETRLTLRLGAITVGSVTIAGTILSLLHLVH